MYYQKNLLKLGLISLFVTGCSTPINYNQNGSINLGFKFPQKSFSIKTIPANTESIEINISGEGIESDNPIVRKISRDNSNVIVNEIPIGEKSVDVKAFDSTNNLIAESSAKTNIEPGKASQVTVELKEMLNELKVKLDNYPSNGAIVISKLTVGSQVIEKESSGNEIDFGKVISGQANIRVSVFTSDSTPIAYTEKTFETSSNESVSLDSFSLPNLSDVFVNSIPKEFLDALRKVIINFKNNNTPVVSNIKMYVNGQEKKPSFSNKVSTCINAGDKLKLEVQTTDADRDNLNYFWARTSISGDKFNIQLQPEKTSILEKTVDFSEGNHAIGVTVTDRKSYVGPYTMYVTVSPTTCP